VTRKLAFERVIIETTGRPIRGRLRRVSLIDEKSATIIYWTAYHHVDAKHASKQLDDFREAQDR